VDFIKLFDRINYMKCLAAGERALSRPPGESTRGKDKRRIDGERKMTIIGLDLQEFHLTATECHLPYGITQCYLPPYTSEHTPP